MALQGNLRDFGVTEIMQLLGTQRKTGALLLECGTERAQIHVVEGRIIGTRLPGMKPDDPLLQFLIKVHRLSDEQRRGILSIHKESGRDLEDLLVNGRYIDGEEFQRLLERQILNDLLRIVHWEDGTYRFDPRTLWPAAPIVRLSMEGALIEAARRSDEQKRFQTRFANPHDLLGVRDLPDPDEPLSEEEKEIFGIIDGQHTVTEVVEMAPLAEYEAYEALDRMLDAQWIEIVGRREPDAIPVRRSATGRPPAQPSLMREILIGGLVLAIALGLRLGAGVWRQPQLASPEQDVFVQAQVGEIRQALELYRRERGTYPPSLRALEDDDWIGASQARVWGYDLRYVGENGGASYRLAIVPR